MTAPPVTATSVPGVVAPSDSRLSPAVLLMHGARAWRLSPHTTLFLSVFVPLLVVSTGVVTALLGSQAFRWFTAEDGFAESLQVLIWACAWILIFPMIGRLRQARASRAAATYGVICLGVFFIIGEEVSWGQRIIGWETPEIMRATNRQEETNVHNIRGVEDMVRWAHLAVVAFGTFAPMFLIRRQLRATPLDPASLFVPHYTLVPYLAPVLLWRIQAMFWHPPTSIYFVVTKFSEVMELVLATAFLLFMVYQLRNVGPGARTAVRGSTQPLRG